LTLAEQVLLLEYTASKNATKALAYKLATGYIGPKE
jgi:hypothetical protein